MITAQQEFKVLYLLLTWKKILLNLLILVWVKYNHCLVHHSGLLQMPPEMNISLCTKERERRQREREGGRKGKRKISTLCIKESK